MPGVRLCSAAQFSGDLSYIHSFNAWIAASAMTSCRPLQSCPRNTIAYVRERRLASHQVGVKRRGLWKREMINVLSLFSRMPPAPLRWPRYPDVSSLSPDLVVINRRNLNGLLCNGSSCPPFYTVVVRHSLNLEQTLASIISPSTVEGLSLVNGRRTLGFFDSKLEGDRWALRIPALWLFVSHGLTLDSIWSRVQLRGIRGNTSDCS